MSTTDDLTILPYHPDALEQVRDLHAHAFETLARHHHSAEQIRAHTRLTQSAAYAEDVAASNMLMAYLSDQLVATAGWVAHPERENTARLRKVFVTPGLARAGLGRRVARAAETIARDAGHSRFFVRANVNARGFYERLGYLPHSTGIMEACGVGLPVVFMKKG